MTPVSNPGPSLLAPVPQRELNSFLSLVEGFAITRCCQLIAEFGIADVLGDTPERVAEIAAKAGVDASALGRVLRYAATIGVFEATGDGRFTHTTRSRLLRGDHPQSLKGRIRNYGPGWIVFGALDHSLRTGRPAAEALAPGGLWEWLGANPHLAKVFDEAMTSQNRGDLPALLQAYDFSGFRSFADIGGGQGHLLRGLLEHVPAATGTLFDRPAVVDVVRAHPVERMSIVGGDFFTDALPEAEAYLLSQVLHNWDDENAVSILRNVRSATAGRSTLFVFEEPLPATAMNACAGSRASRPIFMDFSMLAWSSGRERTCDEYEKLLNEAGWRLERVVPAACYVSILAAVPI